MPSYFHVDDAAGTCEVRYFKLEVDEGGNLVKTVRVQLCEQDVMQIHTELHADHSANSVSKDNTWMANSGGKKFEKHIIDKILKEAKGENTLKEESYKNLT